MKFLEMNKGGMSVPQRAPTQWTYKKNARWLTRILYEDSYGLSFQSCHLEPTVAEGMTQGVCALLVTADLRPTSRITY